MSEGGGGDGGGGVSTEKIPPPSRVSSKGGGGEGMCRPGTPPSRNSSEGGVGDGVSKRKHSLRLTFQVREGGCVDQEPLRLAIQARGVGDALTKETPPSSRVSSEGGGGSSNTMKGPSLRRVASVGSQ